MTMIDQGDGEEVVWGRFWEQWTTNSYSAPQETPLNICRLAIGHCEVNLGQWPQVTLIDLKTHMMQGSSVTASHALTPITSTIPIQVIRTTPRCVYSRFRWNLVEGCSSYDVITSSYHFFYQKLRKRRPISYGKFQRDTPNGVASSSENSCGVATTLFNWRGLNDWTRSA